MNGGRGLDQGGSEEINYSETNRAVPKKEGRPSTALQVDSGSAVRAASSDDRSCRGDPCGRPACPRSLGVASLLAFVHGGCPFPQ